jgi:hypothetical protein
VSECDTHRRIKADHLRPTRNLQPLSIPKSKWENICMNFIMGLPHTSRGYNSIWVIVDRLTKSAHFVPIATTYRVRPYMSYTYPTLSAIMASRRPSSSIGDLSLLLIFGSNYMSVWPPISSEAQPITPRQMDRQSESIKSSKICSVLMF